MFVFVFVFMAAAAGGKDCACERSPVVAAGSGFASESIWNCSVGKSVLPPRPMISMMVFRCFDLDIL